MDNLFAINLSPSQIETKESLKSNSVFLDRLISDLTKTFDVAIVKGRINENKYRITAYEPRQSGRYGYGFAFTATPQNVTFTDERGLWLRTISTVLGINVLDRYEKEFKNADLESLNSKVKPLDGFFEYTQDTACGDKYCLNLDLSENDPKLNDKIKLIIRIIMEHGIVTKM